MPEDKSFEEIEKTPEQIKADKDNLEFEMNIGKLKEKIREAVELVFTADVTLGYIEVHADKLFSSFRKMKTSSSEQWDTYVKEKGASEDKMFNIKPSELIKVEYVKTEELDN